MEARPVDAGDALDRFGLARREALVWLTTGGLGAALLGRGVAKVAAQDVTPTSVSAAGVTPEILGHIAPPGAPGYGLQLVRITFAPGAAVAAHRHSGGTVTTQGSDSHSFTVLDGHARLIRAGSATPAAGADAGEPMMVGQEYTLTPGSDRPLTEFIPDLATPVA